MDVEPTTFISDEAIWEDSSLINQVVANAYGALLCGFNRETANDGWNWAYAWAGNLDSATSDFASHSDAPLIDLATELYTSATCPMVSEIWEQQYILIRRCNTIIEEITGVSDSVLSEEERLDIEAQTRFLRAFGYFELARTFGKAPLILEAQDITDDLLVAPSTFDEIIDFIVEDCDACYQNLPLTVEADDLGRVTQGAFLALKARALLYQASPLNTADDTEKWVAAYQAAEDVMDLGLYDLYKSGDTPFYSVCFDDTTSNTEFIFERRFSFPDAPHNIYMMWSLDVDATSRSWNTLYPTQNLVDAYETLEGYTYDPQNPYANRDLRFEQSILHHGSQWQTTEVNIAPSGASSIQTNRARCGYGLKKFIEELAPGISVYYEYAQSNNFPLFRYSEVLLNYAEARNEALDAPDQSVCDAVNQIRSRAGLANLTTSLSKDEMREKIRNERRLELLLEEHRFYDLRRWMDYDTLNESIKGVSVSEDGVYTYNDAVETRNFTGTYYYLPIPYEEQTKNPLLAD